jgi:hypothetical protein
MASELRRARGEGQRVCVCVCSTLMTSSMSSPAATSRSGRHAWYLTLSSKPSLLLLLPPPPTRLLQPAASVLLLRRRTNSNTSSASAKLANLSGWRQKPPWEEQRARRSGGGVTTSSCGRHVRGGGGRKAVCRWQRRDQNVGAGEEQQLHAAAADPGPQHASAELLRQTAGGVDDGARGTAACPCRRESRPPEAAA